MRGLEQGAHDETLAPEIENLRRHKKPKYGKQSEQKNNQIRKRQYVENYLSVLEPSVILLQ